MKLTASQINHIDVIMADMRASEETLRIAMNYHSNKLYELQKDEIKFWEELISVHGLDPDIKWRTKKVGGFVSIVKVEDDE